MGRFWAPGKATYPNRCSARCYACCCCACCCVDAAALTERCWSAECAKPWTRTHHPITPHAATVCTLHCICSPQVPAWTPGKETELQQLGERGPATYTGLIPPSEQTSQRALQTRNCEIQALPSPLPTHISFLQTQDPLFSGRHKATRTKQTHSLV